MKRIKCFTALVTIFYLSSAYSQSGPAGVGSAITNSFWLDANKLLVADGSPVSVFTDVSGNGNDFNQLSSTRQPTFSSTALNGLPTLVFDGTSDCMLSNSISALESNELTWFVVYKKAPLQAQGLIGGNYGATTASEKLWESYCNGSNNKMINSHYSSGSIKYNYFIDDGSTYNFLSNVITPTSLKTYKNGTLMGTRSATYSVPPANNFITLGRHPSITSSYYLDGEVAEAIAFNEALNDLERVLVENYLGAKYGFSIPTDLYSFQGTHNMGVIGLGNDGTNSHTDSQGTGAVRISSPTAMTSNEYLLTGHTNIDMLTYETGDLPPAVSTHTRWSRTWRVDETGEIGDITLVFDMSGVNAFGEPLTYSLLVDSDDGDFSNASVVSGVYDSGSQTMTFVTNLNTGDYFTISGVFLPPVAIHSVQSGDWSDVDTWDCSCIPTISDTVYVENSDVVDVDIEGFTYDLQVEASATLNMTQDVLLSILGDFTVLGSVGFTNGTLGLVGSSSQTLSAGGGSIGLNEVLIENTGTSNINFTNGEFVLNNTLHPNNGVMNINSGGVFVINSTSGTTTGRIGQMQGSFSVVGNVTAKRFLPAGTADERTISSPVIGADLSMWDNDIEISGDGFPDGCAMGSDGDCYFSAKTFRGGEFGTEYIDITNPNEPLLNGVGYELFIGDDLNVFSGATLSSTGTLHGTSDFVDNSLSFQWNIVGNPFASPILFSSLTKSQVSDYFYVYDAATGSYQWYDGGSNTSSIPELSNGILAMGQGFWMYGGNVPSITYKQSDKASGTATFIRASQNKDASIYITMSEEGTTYENTISVGFIQGAKDGMDSLDIIAFTVGEQKASSILISHDEELLAKNYMKADGRDKVLDLSVKILNNGYFTISGSNLNNVVNYRSVTLIDNLTGEVVDLKAVRGYSFYASADDELSQRFQLILSNEVVLHNENSIFETGMDDSDITITQLGTSINIESEESIEGVAEVSIVNLLGQGAEYSESINIEAGSNMVFIPENLSGMYLVVIKSSNGVKTKKIML